MNRLFSLNNLLIGLIYSCVLLMSLLAYAYCSINITFLRQGALSNEALIYLPLDRIYLGACVICFFYHALYTTYLSEKIMHLSRYSHLKSVSWLFDTALFFTFLAYCIVCNYIDYYHGTAWTSGLIFKSFLLSNPAFYILLIIYILLNFSIHICYKKIMRCQK